MDVTLKGKVKKEVDGHWHPQYGVLKAGTVVDVELIPTKHPKTGADANYFPEGVFEPEGWTPPEGDFKFYISPDFKPEGEEKEGEA